MDSSETTTTTTTTNAGDNSSSSADTKSETEGTTSPPNLRVDTATTTTTAADSFDGAKESSTTTTTTTTASSTTTTTTPSSTEQQSGELSEQKKPAATTDNNDPPTDDMASKAAVALAAVAAAAVANNKSPIAAAKEARDLAQTLVQDRFTASFQTVSLSAVKAHLRQRSLETGSSVADRLGQGENDALVQHLLLLQGFICNTTSNTDDDDDNDGADPSGAAAQVDGLLQRIEAAYDALTDMLPSTTTTSTSSNENGGPTTHMPGDLLPHTAPAGDVTLAFFSACLGEQPPPPVVSPSSSSADTPEAAATAPPTATTPTTTTKSSVFNMFKKIRKKALPDTTNNNTSSSLDNTNTTTKPHLQPGEYRVHIDREMLGLTVENVLERTVVRTIVPGGPAKKAGARVGSLICAVGNQDTHPLTHFETIDELRQANRPLVLVLRQLPEAALRAAREEMGRLIQGAGFGLSGRCPDPRLEVYARCLHQRLGAATASGAALSKKEESVAMVGEKLVWILTLLVVGLEQEKGQQEEAARSVAKTLLDYTLHKVLPKPPPPPPPPRRTPGMGQKPKPMKNRDQQQPLIKIGEVLQRTRNFLADPLSPPAALLRGELIAFLCDLLDLDTEMELTDEQEASDLGSAGSLLKLIVLNCPLMKQSPMDASVSTGTTEDESESSTGGDVVPSNTLNAGNRFLAIVHRLAASRSTSARIAACSLGPVLWSHLDFPHQLQLRGVITRALHDVEVLVRKSTATVLHEIAELVFDSRSVPWLVLMCERAMTDPEPQLRSAAMTLTWHLAEHLPNAFFGDARQGSRYLCRLPDRDDPLFADVYLLQCKLLPVATRLAEDRSPSVRLAVAAQSDRLCDAMGDHWSSVIIDVLLGLLSDSDERVRCEAVSCVPRLAEIVLLSTKPGERSPSEVSILEALLPAAIKLQNNSAVSVRVALASAAGELLTLLVALQSRQDRTMDYKRHTDERLIPMVQNLLNDSDPEVTSAGLRAVTNATRQRKRHMSVASTDGAGDDISLSSATTEPVVVPVLSEEQVLGLLPTLTELSDSKQWRVRQSAVEIVPALVGCTTESSTRVAISQMCVKLLGDKVDAVRTTAAECLCMGMRDDTGWMDVVVSTIQQCASHPNAKQRLLSLKMIPTAIVHGASTDLVETALSLRNDSIANVRLNVGRSLELVLGSLDETATRVVAQGLQQQYEAESNTFRDADVLYFCKRCLKKAEGTLRYVSDGIASSSK